MKNHFALAVIFIALALLMGANQTAQASPSAQSNNCNVATFIKDVTFPDNGVGKGATLRPGTKFRKTWQIKNVGLRSRPFDERLSLDPAHQQCC